jgi:plasmid stability protein
MLDTMRTTINLPDGLAEAAKAQAVAEGRTLTSLVAEGLRTVLQRGESVPSTDPLPTFGDPGGRMLVDILDREALWTALDDDRPR